MAILSLCVVEFTFHNSKTMKCHLICQEHYNKWYKCFKNTNNANSARNLLFGELFITTGDAHYKAIFSGVLHGHPVRVKLSKGFLLYTQPDFCSDTLQKYVINVIAKGGADKIANRKWRRFLLKRIKMARLIANA